MMRRITSQKILKFLFLTSNGDVNKAGLYYAHAGDAGVDLHAQQSLLI